MIFNSMILADGRIVVMQHLGYLNKQNAGHISLLTGKMFY
jgi:hypothetical protein